jgi:hypothetical protein
MIGGQPGGRQRKGRHHAALHITGRVRQFDVHGRRWAGHLSRPVSRTPGERRAGRGTRRAATAEEVDGTADSTAGLGEGGRRQPMDHGEFGVAWGHHGEHAGPADAVSGPYAAMAGNDSADPGQVEFIDHRSGFHTHRRIIALIGFER